jgi:cytoskeletal protein RodZ
MTSMQNIETTEAATFTVGERLRQRRVELGLTIRDLASITKIQASHLQYLEEDRYEEFPAEVFARGFLKNYAKELRLDQDDIIEAYEGQTGRASAIVPVVDLTPERSDIQENRFADPATLGRIAYGVALAVFICGLALSALVFSNGDDTSTAAYQPNDASESWQPLPASDNDWQSYREN